jgi:hypothetical protein
MKGPTEAGALLGKHIFIMYPAKSEAWMHLGASRCTPHLAFADRKFSA